MLKLYGIIVLTFLLAFQDHDLQLLLLITQGVLVHCGSYFISGSRQYVIYPYLQVLAIYKILEFYTNLSIQRHTRQNLRQNFFFN